MSRLKSVLGAGRRLAPTASLSAVFSVVLGLAVNLPLDATAQTRQTADKYDVENYVPEFTETELSSRLETTRAELQRQTGRVPENATRVHPVITADWFLDAAGAVKAGKVLPGAPFVPLTVENGMTKVRLSGWQLTDVPRVLYGEAGQRVLLATLGQPARDHRQMGDPVTLPATGQTWAPVQLEGWIASADLTAATDALWNYAQALYTANCAQCHAAPHLDEFDANQWSGQLDAMVPSTNLLRGEARLLQTYLQLHAADTPAQGTDPTQKSAPPKQEEAHVAAAIGAAPAKRKSPSSVEIGRLLLTADQIADGQLVYLEKCAECHGADASGGTGPDVTGILVKDVVASAFGVENMPAVDLSEGEAEAIAFFLMSLAPDQAKKRLDLQRR